MIPPRNCKVDALTEEKSPSVTALFGKMRFKDKTEKNSE